MKNGKPCILVVEDQPALLELCAAVLSRYGVEVIKAEDATKGLEVFVVESEKIDGILTDIDCKRKGTSFDGTWLIKSIMSSKHKIPAIKFMSGNIWPYTEEYLIKLSGSSYLLKPFQISDLVSWLQTVVGII